MIDLAFSRGKTVLVYVVKFDYLNKICYFRCAFSVDKNILKLKNIQRSAYVRVENLLVISAAGRRIRSYTRHSTTFRYKGHWKLFQTHLLLRYMDLT